MLYSTECWTTTKKYAHNAYIKMNVLQKRRTKLEKRGQEYLEIAPIKDKIREAASMYGHVMRRLLTLPIIRCLFMKIIAWCIWRNRPVRTWIKAVRKTSYI